MSNWGKPFNHFCFSFSKKQVRELLPYAGLPLELNEVCGRMAVISFFFSVFLSGVFFAGSFLLSFDIGIFERLIASLLLVLVLWLLGQWVLSIWLFYRVEGRRDKVEKILPDFLLLVASNVRAGSTPFSAFRSAAIPQFGVLSDEVRTATAKSLGSQSFESALSEISSRVKSRVLLEVISLFSQSMKQGSNFARLLETLAFDLRRSHELQKELLANTKVYVLFVGFVVVVATPILLSISVQFLRMAQYIQDQSLTAVSSGSVLNLVLTVTPDFMVMAAVLLLVGNALLASLLMGLLKRGRLSLGLTYFPILLVVSLVLFWIFLRLLSNFFVLGPA